MVGARGQKVDHVDLLLMVDLLVPRDHTAVSPLGVGFKFPWCCDNTVIDGGDNCRPPTLNTERSNQPTRPSCTLQQPTHEPKYRGIGA